MPTQLVKFHGSEEENCWRYLMAWERTSVGSEEVSAGLLLCPVTAGEETVNICISVTDNDCYPFYLKHFGGMLRAT